MDDKVLVRLRQLLQEADMETTTGAAAKCMLGTAQGVFRNGTARREAASKNPGGRVENRPLRSQSSDTFRGTLPRRMEANVVEGLSQVVTHIPAGTADTDVSGWSRPTGGCGPGGRC